MFTLNDIKKLKFEMEEEGLLTCSEMFIERLRDLEADMVGDALKQSTRVGYVSTSIGNTPPNTDGEGGYINPNV